MRDEHLFLLDMARNDFLSFCIYTDKFFEIAPHHQIIADKLTKFMNGEIKNLILTLPPRSWKSRLMQEFIAYLYWRKPEVDILYTWHSLSLLQWFSRNIRSRMQSVEYQQIFNTRFKWDNKAINNWSVENGGEFSIYGVGWWITWKGWDVLIIDDPYSTREEAESETIRTKVSEWYWSTFLSRRQTDKSQQIIIMQRWREDDLVWEILEKEPDNWEVVKIPALNNKWESFRPERFSPEYFEKIKNDWPLYFASQYQQEPVSAEWWDFKKEYFEYYDDVSDRIHLMNIYSFIDPAISEKQEADFTAIVTIWVLNNVIYVLEIKHLKTTPDNIINEVFETAMRFKTVWKSYKFWIEVVQYQKMLSLEITKQMRLRNQFFTLNETRPTWEKNARIRTVLQPRYSAHNIIHPKNNISDLELELLKFPKWKHDDLIDALAWTVAMSQVNINTNNIITPEYI